VSYITPDLDEAGKKQLADVVLAMRKDLLGRKTKLKHDDIKYFMLLTTNSNIFYFVQHALGEMHKPIEN
jgi:hypothetical protein